MGDLAGARKTQQEALALRQKLGEKESIAESQLALALISLEEARPADAEAVIRTAVSQFHAENVPDLEASAYALLARALMDQGELKEATDAAKSATTLAAHSQEPMLKLSVAIADARVRAANVHAVRNEASAQAIRKLGDVVRETRKLGFVGLELEARLAILEIEKRLSGAATALEQSPSLGQEALAKGYGLIARKAAAARVDLRPMGRNP